MDKYLNDKGEVGVLVSPGYGAGWSSWNTEYEDAIFNPVLVDAVVKNICTEELVKKEYPDAYIGGLPLEVEWVKQGEKFYLHEYDGNEWIVREDEFYTA